MATKTITRRQKRQKPDTSTEKDDPPSQKKSKTSTAAADAQVVDLSKQGNNSFTPPSEKDLKDYVCYIGITNAESLRNLMKYYTVLNKKDILWKIEKKENDKGQLTVEAVDEAVTLFFKSKISLEFVYIQGSKNKHEMYMHPENISMALQLNTNYDMLSIFQTNENKVTIQPYNPENEYTPSEFTLLSQDDDVQMESPGVLTLPNYEFRADINAQHLRQFININHKSSMGLEHILRIQVKCNSEKDTEQITQTHFIFASKDNGCRYERIATCIHQENNLDNQYYVTEINNASKACLYKKNKELHTRFNGLFHSNVIYNILRHHQGQHITFFMKHEYPLVVWQRLGHGNSEDDCCIYIATVEEEDDDNDNNDQDDSPTENA